MQQIQQKEFEKFDKKIEATQGFRIYLPIHNCQRPGCLK